MSRHRPTGRRAGRCTTTGTWCRVHERRGTLRRRRRCGVRDSAGVRRDRRPRLPQLARTGDVGGGRSRGPRCGAPGPHGRGARFVIASAFRAGGARSRRSAPQRNGDRLGRRDGLPPRVEGQYRRAPVNPTTSPPRLALPHNRTHTVTRTTRTPVMRTGVSVRGRSAWTINGSPNREGGAPERRKRGERNAARSGATDQSLKSSRPLEGSDRRRTFASSARSPGAPTLCASVHPPLVLHGRVDVCPTAPDDRDRPGLEAADAVCGAPERGVVWLLGRVVSVS